MLQNVLMFQEWLAKAPSEEKDDTKKEEHDSDESKEEKLKRITENLASFKMLSSSSSDQTMISDLSRSLSSTRSNWSSGSEK